MNKTLLLLALVLGSYTSFAQSGQWEDWQKTSCYSKIAFRLKDEGMRGEQHVWKVQFKNDYGHPISFNYHVTDKLEQYDTTTHRKAMNNGRVSDEIEIFTKYEDIFLMVDKVSLSPYPKDFIDCDRS